MHIDLFLQGSAVPKVWLLMSSGTIIEINMMFDLVAGCFSISDVCL